MCFGDAGDPTQRDCTMEQVRYRDVDGDGDGDGDLDVVLRFPRSEAGIDAGDTAACLTFPQSGGGLHEACGAVFAK
jgi:hypothetical protein